MRTLPRPKRREAAWWPDESDGISADEDEPARWRLTDDPLTIAALD